MNTVIIGAGKTGRGFVGRILCENKVPFTFIDCNGSLIDKLNSERKYAVSFFENVREDIVVQDYTALHIAQPQALETVQAAQILFVSVGGENIESVAKFLAAALTPLEVDRRKTVILCENMIHGQQKFIQTLTGFSETSFAELAIVESAIFCTTIEQQKSELAIYSENYPSIPFHKHHTVYPLPNWSGLIGIDNFDTLIKRKIYTYNAASAIIAYLGACFRYESYSQAANDPQIKKLLDRFYAAINFAICAEYHISNEEQDNFAIASYEKFRNPEIFDSIERNARQPARKLSGDERIAFPLKLLIKYNTDTTVLCITAAAAICYGFCYDNGFKQDFFGKNIADIFENLSGVQDKDTLRMIERNYELLKENYGNAEAVRFLLNEEILNI